MPNESQHTLCEPNSPVFAVQSTPDCLNVSKSPQISQPDCLSSAETPLNTSKDCAKEHVEIPLSGDGPQFAIIDAEDWELVRPYKWTAWKNHETWYARSTTNVLMHRLILGITKAGRRIETDHRDRNGVNNCRGNLRIASRSVNLQNRRKFKNCKSGFVGVHPSGKRWYARIYSDGKTISLGSHDTPEQAARAYDAKALELYGPDAALNFPCPADRRAA